MNPYLRAAARNEALRQQAFKKLQARLNKVKAAPDSPATP